MDIDDFHDLAFFNCFSDFARLVQIPALNRRQRHQGAGSNPSPITGFLSNGCRRLQPVAVVDSFAFTRGNTEYVMRLEHWGSRPSLVFATRKWRDASRNRLFRWFRQIARLEPLTVNVKFTCELEEDDASAKEIRRCFLSSLGAESRLHSVLQTA